MARSARSSDLNPGPDVWDGRFTEEQLRGIAESSGALVAKRKHANFVPIMEMRRPRDPEPEREGPAPYWEKNNPPREPQRIERNCASCGHASDFNDEHRRAYCIELKKSVSTWHPCLCNAFTDKVRERRVKWEWKGIVYG